MTKSEKFESALLLIVFILSCVVCGYWCYWKLTYTNHTHITNYAQRLTYTEDGEYPIEINIFTNENGNGKGVFEIKFNYYMDTETPVLNVETGKYEYKNIYSSGLQLELDYNLLKNNQSYVEDFIPYKSNVIGFFAGNNSYYQFEESDKQYSGTQKYKVYKPYFYNMSFGDGFSATNVLDFQDNFIIDINEDDTTKMAKLMQNNNFVNTGKTFWFGKNHHRYDFVDFVRHFIINVAPSIEDGIDSYVFDLSKWFHIDLENEDGQFVQGEDASVKQVYIPVLVTKTKNGLVSSEQSLFGLWKNNNEYGSASADYWKSYTNYTLTERDFDFTKIADNKYSIKISNACSNYLRVFSDIKLNLILDLDSNYLANRNIVITTLAEDFSNGLDLSSVTILSDTAREISSYEILSNVTTENVTIIYNGGVAV